MNKKILYTLAFSVLTALNACTGDLDQYPELEITSKDVYTSAEKYNMVLAKLYSRFTMKGQEKGGGDRDIPDNSEKDDGYMRSYCNLQELGTDEMISQWAEGDNMGGIMYLQWDANDQWVNDFYYQLVYSITLANEFIRNCNSASLPDEEMSKVEGYKTEARFIRALCYYHALDFFNTVPFTDEKTGIGASTPPSYSRKQMFDFLETELKDIAEKLPETPEYGRAGKYAVYALLSRLYLNAEVYTGEKKYNECIEVSDKILSSGKFMLESDYSNLFKADNYKCTGEIIFPFVVDSENSASWGVTSLLVCGAVQADDAKAYIGSTGGWGNFRPRQEIPALFGLSAADENTDNGIKNADTRCMFWCKGLTFAITKVTEANQGFQSVKWKNSNQDGKQSCDAGANGVDTDFPMFRLGEIYLNIAEAKLRGGTGSGPSAVECINKLRERAYGSNYATSGKVEEGALTLDFMLDERAREMYLECVRRTDLIRFGRFTGGDNFSWRGKVMNGTSVDKKYNCYPLPAYELSANPNLKNEGY